MKAATKLQRVSAAIAALAVTLSLVWSIAGYAYPDAPAAWFALPAARVYLPSARQRVGGPQHWGVHPVDGDPGEVISGPGFRAGQVSEAVRACDDCWDCHLADARGREL